MLVIVGTRTDAHSLRSQVGIGSESDCLLGQLERILRISDSEAGLKEEKSGGVVGEEGECGDDVLGLLERETDVGYFVREEGSKAVGERNAWSRGR